MVEEHPSGGVTPRSAPESAPHGAAIPAQSSQKPPVGSPVPATQGSGAAGEAASAGGHRPAPAGVDAAPPAPAGVDAAPPAPAGIGDAVLPTPAPARARGRARRLAVLASLAVVAAGAAGVFAGWPTETGRGSTPTAGSRTPSATSTWVATQARRDPDIAAALATMTQAFAAGDERSFVSVATGSRDLTKHQRELFQGLSDVGAEGVRFSWPGGWVDPYRDSVPADAVHVAVDCSYRLPRYLRGTSHATLYLIFAPVAGRWRLVGDRDLPPAERLVVAGGVTGGAGTDPWLTGEVSVVRRDHVLVVGDRGKGESLRRIATAAEAETATVRRYWKKSGWDGKAVVYASTRTPFLRAWFGRRADPGHGDKGDDDKGDDASDTGTFEALATQLWSEASESGSPRIVVAPSVFAEAPAELARTFRHELTHVALDAKRSGSPPTWAAEGLAEYLTWRPPGGVDAQTALLRRGMPRPMWQELRRSGYRVSLERDQEDFYAGSGLSLARAYTTSWLACLYIADTYGEQTLRDFARAVYRGPDDAADSEKEALRSVLHTDRSTFQRRVARYARTLRSHFV